MAGLVTRRSAALLGKPRARPDQVGPGSNVPYCVKYLPYLIKIRTLQFRTGAVLSSTPVLLGCCVQYVFLAPMTPAAM